MGQKLAFRIISRIDVKPPHAVKGVNLEGLRQIGNPVDLAEKYYSLGVDEIFIQDVIASLYGTPTLGGADNFNFPKIFIPITVGGGIRSPEDAIELIQGGADKISINSAGLRNPTLLKEISNIVGTQALVVNLEAKTNHANSWDLMMDSGREKSEVGIERWLSEIQELGAGEIIVTSIDREGTRVGIDHKLIEYVRERSQVPLIVHGGIGSKNDVVEAINLGANGVAIASALHYNVLEIIELKAHLAKNGFEVRI
jgi:cyclase